MKTKQKLQQCQPTARDMPHADLWSDVENRKLNRKVTGYRRRRTHRTELE